MATVTRELARNAEAEVRRANELADQLEADSKAARERAAAAGRTSQDVAREFGRISASQTQAASNELRQLRAAVDAVLAEKPDKAQVMHDTRFAARTLLTDYVLGDGKLPTLGDPLWGALHGLQGQVQAFMGRLDDEDRYNAADDLECKLHRACRARLSFLAGEE